MILRHSIVQGGIVPPKSVYSIGSAGVTLLAAGSDVKALRTLRRHGYIVPAEMNGPQTKSYEVELKEEPIDSGLRIVS